MSGPDQRAEEILKRLPPPENPILVIGGGVFVAEVGVWDGQLSQRLLQRPDLTLFMVDRWVAVRPGHRYFHSGAEIAQKSAGQHLAAKQAAIQRTLFAGPRAVLCQGESVHTAMILDSDVLHLAFIDANHTYEAVMEDLISWWPNVRAGGWIGGHDWDHPKHQADWGVRQAVEEWREENGIASPIELGENRTWFLQKADDAQIFEKEAAA